MKNKKEGGVFSLCEQSYIHNKHFKSICLIKKFENKFLLLLLRSSVGNDPALFGAVEKWSEVMQS